MDDESVAGASTGAMGEPERSAWSGTEAPDTRLLTVHRNDAEPAYPALSVAVITTSKFPPVVGMPEITPVEGSTVRPGGSVPPSDQVTVATVELSVAVTVTGVAADPETFDCADGPVTVTVSVTAQVKASVAAYPAPSVAVTTTAKLPPVVGVPEITPVDGSTARPGGSVPPSE